MENTRPVDLVLSRLQKVKRSANGWRACCPAHDDRRPSLSITEAEDGKVLLKCHAGCDFADVVSAMDLEVADLFPTNGRESEGRRIVATYDYTDERGNLLYQTVRYHPKDFRQRRPDSNGGWIWDLNTTLRVLYHLPEIVAARPDQPIFICEGEKSADAIRTLGLVATTAPLGAGKWRKEYNDALAGRNVVFLPDLDPEGQNHALTACEALSDTAESRRIVELPAVTSRKSDPADWVSAGGTRDELLRLVEATPEVEEIPLSWDKDGNPTTEDYVAALASLGYHFRMNTCSDMVEVNKEPISDARRAKMRSQMRDLGYRNVNVMEDAWIASAYDNRYHPVQEYLESLKWDGRDHMSHLMSYIEDKYGFLPVFFRRWAIGAVARAYEMTQNRLLILDGEQGIGKSYLVRWLASPVSRPELFIEGPINPDDKDNLVRLITAWIWEVSELGSTTRRSDREALKYFLSLEQVTVRKPYGRYDLVKPALSSFIGTVNNEAGILDDPTGYRRFMSAEITRMNWEYAQRIDPNQIWAQARALYVAGETWHLRGDEADMASYANSGYEVEDPLEDLFRRCFEITRDPTHFVATVDIQAALRLHDWRLKSPRAETMAIGGLMKKLGLQKSSSKDQRGYEGIRQR